MPSERYNERKALFDRVFANGVDPFVHPTGVTGVRLVVRVPEADLDPFYQSPYGQRAHCSGDHSIFLADSLETARAEVLPGEHVGCYPPNSWCLEYRYAGNILDISRFPDELFKREFLAASGELKHEFSQDARHYLTERGMIDRFDSIGWPSVEGERLAHGGYVYNWVSGIASNFEYLGKERLDRDI
jgi:hypothetical protein